MKPCGGRSAPAFSREAIPIEALSEFDVQEIHFDGKEVLEKPLTPAETFQRIVNKIDFSKDYELEANSSFSNQNQTNDYMWNSLKDAVRNPLTEVTAFVDILQVIIDGRYLSLYPVAPTQTKSKLNLALAGKRMALASAADMLIKGAERLRKRHAELADSRCGVSISLGKEINESTNYHENLKQLRREWRLKTNHHTVIGDISLRCIGSRFREPGTFEVCETEILRKRRHISCLPTPSGSMKSLDVLFCRGLETLLQIATVARLRICFHKTGTGNADSNLLWNLVFPKREPLMSRLVKRQSSKAISDSDPPREKSQSERLAAAQQLLACREILATLTQEASRSTGPNGPSAGTTAFSTQDEILATIFPGVQISVSLWKNRRSPFSCDEDKETEELNEEEAGEERASNTAGSSLLPFGRSTIPRKRPCLLAALSRSTSAQATSSQALGAIASSFEPQGAQPMASTLTSAPTSPPGLEDASCCLAVQLHRLLARIHRSAWPNLASLPQPSTCPVQVPARLRAAGALVFPMQRISPAAAPIHAPASAPVAAVSPLAATAETASSVAIATAAVAGFAGPAAAAWVAAGMDAVAAASNATGSGSGRVPGSGTAGTWASLAGGGTAGRIATAPICQDRHSLFTEWGSLYGGLQSVMAATVHSGAPATPGDDPGVAASASVAAVEQALCMTRAGQAAMDAVIGSGASLLGRTIRVCRQFYLRQILAQRLSAFVRDSSICVTVHWNISNSAFEATARLTFFCLGYDALRTRLSITVGSSAGHDLDGGSNGVADTGAPGIFVHCPDPPHTCHLGTDLAQLDALLRHQVVYTQAQTLHTLATHLLGWTLLANNSTSGLPPLVSPIDDGPVAVKLFASPSGRFIVCLQASAYSGVQLFAARASPSNEPNSTFQPSSLSGRGHFISLRQVGSDGLPQGPWGLRFREVDLDAITGPHTVARVEVVMIALN